MTNEHCNPYDFINPIRDPKLFAGRREELKEIDYYLELSRSKSPKYTHLALIGERASGKTSLLNMIEYKANEKGFLSIKIPLNKETSSNDILFFKEVIDGIMTKGAEKGMYGGIKGKTYRAFRRLIDNLDIKVESPLIFGTAYIGLKRREHKAGIPQHVLIHDLKELSKEAKKRGIATILLLFDECDSLAQNETLLQKIRNAFMEVEGYILAFSGTERMFPAISNVFSPIPRFFKRINIEDFDFKETEECILKPLTEEESKILDRRSVGEIHWLTGGLPYEVNLISHYMYRRHQETESPTIGLSVDVLDDVLNELERLRKGEHHEIANKIRACGPQQLKALISLTELPRSRQEWLVKYALLDDLQFLTSKKAVEDSRITNLVIEQLKMSGIIEENSDKQLLLRGDQFDFLYLKHYAISKGIKDFFVGFKDDPMMNLHMKLERIMLRDFGEYETHTKFDKEEFVKGVGMGRRALVGAKVRFAKPGRHTILEFTPRELERKFYLGTSNSIRFRINVNYMNEGFVTQVTFKKLEETKKLSDSLNLIKDRLKLADIDLLLKDEIAWNIEGTEFSKQKKYAEAIECFDEAIGINAMFELPWVNKGLALFDLKDYEKALECFEKTIAIHPKLGDAWENKGKTLINLRRNHEALECLNKAIEYEPENWSAWDNRGRALFNLQKYDESIKCFNKVLKVHPDNIEVLSLKASALARLGKFDEALISYKRLIEKDPRNESHFLNKGIMLFEVKKLEGAISDLDKALQINPKRIEAWIVKGLALSEMSRYEEAIECCDKVLGMEPNHGVAWYNKACFESKSGNIDTAIFCLEKAIQLDKLFIDSARTERDFDNIKTDDRFLKLLAKKDT